MSNLTTASGEGSVNSTKRNEIQTFTATNNNSSFCIQQQQQQQEQYFDVPSSNQLKPNNKKRKRNLPGNPDPEAEVIALSPNTLISTNRFICEICNKGFQRDQNLQLHRRGHNLPWKLKQRADKDVIRKKVYVCPDPSCVHHDHSRALGDLTGIKKHFFRKHGEKKWKCEKCSKMYAVQSDWKAHSKICGTKEYRCDCGALFSRRDSFITHRAFCDALAEESARALPNLPLLITNNIVTNNSQINNNNNLQMPPQLLVLNNNNNQPPDLKDLNELLLLKKDQQHNFATTQPQELQLPPWLATHDFTRTSQDQEMSRNPNPTTYHSSLGPTLVLQPSSSAAAADHETSVVPSHHMSATALLQKAAEMGVNISSRNKSSSTGLMRSVPHHDQRHVTCSNSGFGLNLCSRDQPVDHQEPQQTTKTTMITTATTTSPSSSLEDAFIGGVLNNIIFKEDSNSNIMNDVNGGGEDLTRDFLGLKSLSRTDILGMAGLGTCVNATTTNRHQQQQHIKSWQA